MRPTVGVLIGGLAMLACACGSTVANRGGLTPEAAGGTGVGFAARGGSDNGQGSLQASGGPGASPASGGTGVPGSPIGSGAGLTATGSGQAPAGGTTGGSGGAPAGITSTTVTVGVFYPTNNKAAEAALGINTVNLGDPLAEQKAIAADINAHGGVLGRKLVMLGHAIDSTSTDTYAQQAQAACADFTQDHHVFAVLGDIGVDDTFHSCLQSAGVPQISETAGAFDSALTTRRFPMYLRPGNIDQDRAVTAWTPALLQQNFFSKWDISTGKPGVMPVRVGVLTLDDPVDSAAVSNILQPALAKAGFPAYDVYRVSSPKSTGDSGSTLEQIQNAVLKFRSDNITHLLPLDAGAGLALYFGKNASSQHYYPRYGLDSGDGVQVLLSAGLMPTDQLNGAVGYGWEPLLDVDPAHDPDSGPDSNAARIHCDTVMQKAGINVSGAPATRGANEYCDMFYFLVAALANGNGSLTATGLTDGANSLGPRFVAGVTFATRIDATHHDGVAAARNFAFDNGCGCFLYDGPRHGLP